MNLKLGKRKSIAIKNSLMITLPKVWVDSRSLQKGDLLDISIDESGRLVIQGGDALC